MSSQEDNHTNSGATLMQKVVASLGAILAVVALGSLFVKPSADEPAAAAAPVAAAAAVVVAKVEDIKPVAEVEVAAVAGPHTDLSGEEVTKNGCAMCHAAGMMNAPKIGDKAQWEPRIAQGYETLVKHAIEGIRSMPARGGNPALTDGEIANAVAHMANLSGASFTAPAAAPAAEAKPAG
jgi:cytochrome c5